MFSSLRQFRVVLVNFIITLVYAPALSSSQWGRSSQFAAKSVLGIAGNSSLMTLHSALLPPHAEYRLLIKFRAEASVAERSEIMENYGEPGMVGGGRWLVGGQTVTLQLKENVSTALAELKLLDKVIEWVEPDYVVGGRMSVIGGRKALSRSLRNPLAAKNLTPKAAVVAIVDTGLSGKYPNGWNFLNDSD